MKFCITCNGSVYDDHQECTKCLKSKIPVFVISEKEPEAAKMPEVMKLPETKFKKKGK